MKPKSTPYINKRINPLDVYGLLIIFVPFSLYICIYIYLKWLWCVSMDFHCFCYVCTGIQWCWYEILHDSGSWWRHQMETFFALLSLCVGIHRSLVNSPHKGQWRGAFVFFDLHPNKLLSKQSWACDLRRHCAHYDVIVMCNGATWRLLMKIHLIRGRFRNSFFHSFRKNTL